MNNFRKIISAVMAVLMCIPCTVYADTSITSYSNGNDVSDVLTFGNGVFSAVSQGSGMFAIALYSEDELKKLSFADSKEELEEYRVNMVIEDAEKYTMKIFRFDKDKNPLCINSRLNPLDNNREIYVNETFDNGFVARGAKPNGTTTVISDGAVKVRDNYTNNGTRYGTINVPYTQKDVIFEADYMIPSGVGAKYAYLLATYYDNSYHAIVYLHPDGIKKSTAGSGNPALVKRTDIPTDKWFKIAVKFDLENKVYDIYYNREKITASPISISGKISMTNPTDGFGFYAPMIRGNTAGTDTLYVDNIRVYSGTEFADIGDDRVNVHRHDFKNSPSWETDIYERPEAEELAKNALETGHPRVILNRDKINEIKNSSDETIVSIRESVLKKADSYLSTDPYTYKYSNTGSIGNVDDAFNMMMHLGMAYLLTGNSAYPERAYKEAQVLFYVPSKDHWSNSGADRDFWNSYSYLDVSEISAIMAICYDWMYDAWTPAQRTELKAHTMEKGIMRSFRGMFDEYNFNLGDPSDQVTFKMTNNWGAVCNGGMLMAAIAFMETDPYVCSQLAEANIRAFEYYLPNYAPSGAWAEGASYWAYALKYLTMACATLDSISGTDYGIHKTPGLEHSQLYALSCEAKTGVVNFGDVGGGHVNAPFMFYWANKYKNDQIGGARIYSMEQFGFNYSIYDLIYYNAEYIDDNYIHPLTSFYKGTEVVTMTSGYDKDDAYVAISGGKGTATSHDHLDSGGVIAEKNGLRVLCDSGAEHYGADSYFSTNRYFYYKARPEGHNVFVINPQNIISGTATSDKGVVSPVYYHGQDRSAVSEITSYDPDKKIATMDLTAAYGRDAQKAQRKMYLDGERVVIEDEISIRSDSLSRFDESVFSDAGILSDADISSDGNVIEWYYHFKDTATAVVDNVTEYGVTDYGTAVIGEDGKSVTLTFKDYTHNGSKFLYPGTSKSFTLSFESDSDFEIEIRDAVRNPYDSRKIAAMQKAGTFSSDYHNSRNTISKVVVKMKGVSGTVKLKTTLN